jgi:hypothetical protein
MGFFIALAMTTTLAVHGRANATPSVASMGDFTAVVWGASLPSGATDVFVSVSRDGGRTFGGPIRVNRIDGDARLNGEQPPQIGLVARAGKDPSIVVVWTTKGGKGTALLQARSDDGGRSFSSSSLVPGSDAAGNRGWEAIAVERSGRVDAVWLDHREMAADSTMMASHHDHTGASGAKPDGVAMAQKSKLFFTSLDGSVPPFGITGGVCYCCKTALMAAPDGAIYAAWRHVYPGNLRDMAFTVSRDGGKTFALPVRVSEDKWMLEGCPDDGPSMAVDASNRVHLLWPTLVAGEKGADPTIGIFYATSADGRRFTARLRLPAEGTPHHPRLVVAADGSLVASWDEVAGGARRVVVARAAADSSGQPQFRREVLSSGAPGLYPVLATVRDAVVVAWTSGAVSADSTIQVARVGGQNRETR